MAKNMQKRGVALVTVLFFMLVAIIAATALFKWLKYMGDSSAAELKRTEAYQASQAGVETVRAWLQYDANDVGAILGYYLNEKVPVRMDSVLAPLQSNKSQKFSVYLIAADVQSYPYKLKFVSTGTGRNGSRYSQVAIFDLNGLFRVYQPSESSEVNFTQAFFGQMGNLTNSPTLSSAIINGNMTGNQPSVTGSLVVTGNVSLQGSTAVTGKDLYVAGTFTSSSPVTVGGNAYFGNTVNLPSGTPMTINGDAFFNGVVYPYGQLYVGGNTTLNGYMHIKLQDYGITLEKNLVIGKDGGLSFDNLAINNKFIVGGNIWSPNEFIGTTYYYGNVLFGANATTTDPMQLWVPDLRQWSTYNSTQYKWYYDISQCTTSYGFSYCPVWILSKAEYKGAPSGNVPFSGADSLTAYKKLLTDSTSSCTAAGTKNVPDPLLLKDSTSWLAKANPASCKLSTSYTSNVVSELQTCYDALSAANSDDLYNGFLVVRMNASNKVDPTGTLNGKFIIVLDNAGMVSLPPTTSTSIVMLYLPDGAGTILPKATDASTAVYNYFIYSLKNIGVFLKFRGTFYGSVFMANCSKLVDMQAGTFNYSATVVQGLADAGIVKQNPKYGSNSSSDTTETDTTAGYDSYYVSTSPRLKVALESEYANADIDVDTLTASNSRQAIPASVVVLPRIIYLPASTEIKSPLSSFYNTMRLNDGTHAVVDGSASCETVPTSGAIGTLASGVYACTFTPSGSGYNSCKFWVVASENSTTTSTTSSASAATSSSSTATLASSSSVASSSSLSSGSVVVSSSDAYTVTGCYFGTTPVTVGGSTVFNGTLNGVSSLTSVTLRATGATDESWSDVRKTIAHTMQYVPTTAGIYSYQLLYNEKELCTAKLTVINATGCSCTCSSGCGSLNGAAPTANKVGCWFVKKIGWINSTDGIYVNGTLYTGWQGNDFANNITKIDGGYYLESKSTNYSAYSVTAGTPTCTVESSSSSAVSSSSATSSSSAATVSSSSAASSGDTTSVKVAYGTYLSYTAGKCYSLTIPAQGSVWHCSIPTSASSSETLGTFSYTGNNTTMTIDAWQTQSSVTISSTVTSAIFCVRSSLSRLITCAKDW